MDPNTVPRYLQLSKKSTKTGAGLKSKGFKCRDSVIFYFRNKTDGNIFASFVMQWYIFIGFNKFHEECKVTIYLLLVMNQPITVAARSEA
jgi:hypothetical protein